MRYHAPYDQETANPPVPNASYVNGNPGAGIQGSVLDAAAIELVQRDIVGVIAGAGLIPTDANPVANDNQLLQAILLLIGLAHGGGYMGMRKNLVSANDGTQPHVKRNVTADFFAVEDSSGNLARLAAVNLSYSSGNNGAGGLDTGTLAANTVYYEFIIAQPGGANPAAIMSTSSSAPLLPAGYTMKGRVGGVAITDGSKNFYRITLKDYRAQYIVQSTTDNTQALPLLGAGILGTFEFTTTGIVWAALSTSLFVPATANEIILTFLNCYSGGGTDSHIALAPNPNYGGQRSSTSAYPPLFSGHEGSQDEGIIGTMMLESSNIYAICDGANGAVSVLGWIERH